LLKKRYCDQSDYSPFQICSVSSSHALPYQVVDAEDTGVEQWYAADDILVLPEPGVKHVWNDGESVLALYPDTTCFYKGVVVGSVKDGVVVRFEEDADQVKQVSEWNLISFPADTLVSANSNASNSAGSKRKLSGKSTAGGLKKSRSKSSLVARGSKSSLGDDDESSQSGDGSRRRSLRQH
jgi:hypothetical protein